MSKSVEAGLEVFISYSHKDDKFLEALTAYFDVKEIPYWFDKNREPLKGLPAGIQWWQEIKHGIETAENFVFIVSPTSVVSPYCCAEIEYASTHEVRVFPIWLIDFSEIELCIDNISETETVPLDVEVSERNLKKLASQCWAYVKKWQCVKTFIGGTVSDSALEEFLAVLRQDMEYNKKYHQFLQRANQWLAENQDSDFLLRGDDLQKATFWLDEWDDIPKPEDRKKPYPKPLHREYIKESRIHEKNRKRFNTSSIVAAFVAITLLALSALFLYGQSNSNLIQSNNRGTAVAQQAATATVAQGVAIEKAAVSESLRLNTLAESILQQEDGNPERAALLDILAIRTSPMPEVEETLLETLRRTYTVRAYRLPNWANGIATFSPDGSRILITGGFDDLHRAFLISTETGEIELELLGHENTVNAVAYSPDGCYVATGAWDNTARLWNAETGEQLRVFNGHTSEVHAVVFSPDGQMLLTGSLDGTARLWDVSSGEETMRFQVFQPDNPEALALVQDVAFSPSGDYFVIASSNKTVELHNTNTGDLVRRFEGHTGDVATATFSPDGTLLLTGGGDYTARLWEVTTGRELRRFEGHTDLVLGVGFSPDGRYALTGSWDGTAILWSVETGAKMRVFRGHPEQFTGDPALFPRASAAMVLTVAYSPDGRYVLTGSVEDARLWNADLGYTPRVFGNHDGAVLGVAFSPSGELIATASADGNTRLWNVNTELMIDSFNYEGIDAGGPVDVIDITFSPDGTMLAIGNWNQNNIIRLRNVETGTDAGTFVGHTNWITSLAFSPDGQYLLSGSRDNTARLWDIQTQRQIRVFTGHTNWINSVSFSHNGQYVVTGSTDGTARIWSIDTATPMAIFSDLGLVLSVTFSPNDTAIAIGTEAGIVQIQDIATEVIIATLPAHNDWVTNVEYSPNGQYFLTSSYDGTAQLWDAVTYQQLRTFSDHDLGLSDATFSPNSRRILTASIDRTARLWDVDYQDWLAYACTRVFRDFSSLERQEYRLTEDATACEQL